MTEDLKSRRLPACQLFPRPVGILITLHARLQDTASILASADARERCREEELVTFSLLLQLIVKGSLI